MGRAAAILNPPVDGVPVTVVHYPGFSNLVLGDRTPVLVDPKQPGYSELPGSRFQSSWSWIFLVLGAVTFAGLALLEARMLRRLLAHRRRHQMQTANPVKTVY